MENPKMIACIQNVITRLPELRFIDPVNWKIEEGQQWAVIGPNGAGKTLLVDILQRKYAIKEGDVVYGCEGKVNELIKSIAFKDIYSLADCRNSYYQQRWHSTETEDMPTVEDILHDYVGTEELMEILSLFGIKELLPKKIIFLSSGELRKFLIVRTLLSRPRILILDNPFIGLDAPSRDLLVEMLQQMTKLKNVQVVLLLSNPDDIPEMVTDVLPVYNKTCLAPMSRIQFLEDSELIVKLFPFGRNLDFSREEFDFLPKGSKKEPSNHEVTFRMEHVSIKYGTRVILQDLDWEVKNGEKWALFGPNGAGKSTLLSLVYADNPQSYANTLYLFDRKRGSGESIWEIKKRIGYVSPEMHLYYMENVPTLNIVGSGFFDSIGLYRKCNEEQQHVALEWMRVFGIENLKDRLFLTLSSGEQRLALLARAFVKDPDLIILDEPLHGLDISNKKKAAAIIEQFCSRPGKTLIYVTHYPHELPACVDKQFRLVKHT
ncbi:ATP-binding cassette domain-containing protein [Parabacteroides bouchesdurhonensis]|uniref:ATP-binding cassette domain-containing protein n=1 Tax=Parabacteroides bouchesdurhonensis TaxID=1936995 RepID=UPI000C818752|nr:ATP-binding cassette domain-containing protein [Parabacteroides bouchesdurhonensis]